MDETPCFIDMYYYTTIDFIGNKHIELQTLGKEKYSLFLILSVSGDGFKLWHF